MRGGAPQAARRGRRHRPGLAVRIQDPLRPRHRDPHLQAIDGTFPDYSRVIPTANDKLLRIDPRSFEEGVDRVATIASEKTRAVKMSLDRDRVTLSVTSPENGTAAEEVPGNYSAEGIEIGFNARYLLDILGQIEGDTVEVHLADAAARPCCARNDKASALYVLMPMRV
jgi:DNA polymerase-3 subunit beta